MMQDVNNDCQNVIWNSAEGPSGDIGEKENEKGF
jgi:hypothetical protein